MVFPQTKGVGLVRWEEGLGALPAIVCTVHHEVTLHWRRGGGGEGGSQGV